MQELYARVRSAFLELKTHLTNTQFEEIDLLLLLSPDCWFLSAALLSLPWWC